MAYEEDNYRLHCYVIVPEPAFELDVVAGVDEKVYTCQYCEHRDTSSSVMRLHRYYCKKNPKGHVKKKKTGECKCPQCGRVFGTPGGLRSHRQTPYLFLVPRKLRW
ncbi:hypothetical protein DVH05_009611 [Phytophthora capsici]|nr:hypothetical protein DVH05_009611 [Phytophthora capsici]